MKSKNQILQITIPSLESYVKEDFFIGAEAQYSILKNARRNESEIAEIASALGNGYVADLITFSPRRLSFFETIVTIETEARLRNENDLAIIVNKIYNDYIIPLLKSRDPESGKKLEDKILEEMELEISNKVNLAFADFEVSEIDDRVIDRSNLGEEQQIIFNEIRKVHTKIKTRINRGEYTPGECNFADDLDSITKKIVFDSLYNKMMSKKIEELVKPLILNLLTREPITYPGLKKTLERLPCHQGKNRHTFMMIGAPASGKGTSFGMVMVDADVLGIQATDLVRSNTDSYRHLVSNKKELGSNTIHHASFNYDESYIITKKIYNRLREKIQSSEGTPHILIDSVYPTQEKINLGILGGGRLHLYCVSVPVEVSINRAFSRGKKTGRYIDTPLLLKSHRDISKNFHRILIENKGNNIDYVLLDNDVPSGELADLVAEGNLSTKIITVHNLAKLIAFLSKENINITATTKENLYLTTKRKSGMEYINELGQLGFYIEFKEEFAKRRFNIFNPERPLKSSLRAILETKPNLPNTDNSLNTPRIKRIKSATINKINLKKDQYER